MGPSCTTIVRLSIGPPSFTLACYRCDKTAFFEVLMAVVPTLLAQVVLTLRFVIFRSDGLVQITAE